MPRLSTHSLPHPAALRKRWAGTHNIRRVPPGCSRLQPGPKHRTELRPLVGTVPVHHRPTCVPSAFPYLTTRSSRDRHGNCPRSRRRRRPTASGRPRKSIGRRRTGRLDRPPNFPSRPAAAGPVAAVSRAGIRAEQSLRTVAPGHENRFGEYTIPRGRICSSHRSFLRRFCISTTSSSEKSSLTPSNINRCVSSLRSARTIPRNFASAAMIKR